MPFTDDFIQNYAGPQDDLRKPFSPPLGGCGGATACVDLSLTYNPLKTAANRELYAVAYVGTVPHNTSFNQIASFNEIPDFDRVEFSYNEGFSAWNGTQTAINITLDPLTLDNTTGGDAIVSGVELIQSCQFTSPLRSILLTRDNSEEGFARYTYTEDVYFGLDARFYVSGSGITYFQKGIFNDNMEVFIDPELPGTATNGSTVTAFIGNQHSLARYNFPFNVPLSDGESFVVSLGSIQLQFNTNVITC